MNCEGSYLLQTACQNCDKCKEEFIKLTHVPEIKEQKRQSEKLKQLQQKNEILMTNYGGSEEDLINTVEFLNKLNKVGKFLIIDSDGTVGFISKITMNDLEELSSGAIEIIDFSEEPRKVTEEGYEKIEMLS